MPYIIFYYVMLLVFRSNRHYSWKFYITNSIGKHLCWSLFFSLKMIKLYKHLFSMNKLYFCWNVFLIDWCHKHLKNTMDLLLFYREHFYGFLESDLWKHWKKKPFYNKHIYTCRSQTFWSFMKFYFVYILKVCFVFKKQSLCLYLSLYA